MSIIQAAAWPIWALMVCAMRALALPLKRWVPLPTHTVAPAKVMEPMMDASRGGLDPTLQPNESPVNSKKNPTMPEPKIKPPPFIDVLQVVLRLLMLSIRCARLSEINLPLPSADTPKLTARAKQIMLSVRAQRQYAINKTPVGGNTLAALSALLDPRGNHPAVVNTMEAAHRRGLPQIRFSRPSTSSSSA